MTQTANFGLKLPIFNETTWHDSVNGNFTTIDAILGNYITNQNIVGTWTNSISYINGEKVVDGIEGTIWECQIGHVSAAVGTFADERAAHATYWTQFFGIGNTSRTYIVTYASLGGSSLTIPSISASAKRIQVALKDVVVATGGTFMSLYLQRALTPATSGHHCGIEVTTSGLAIVSDSYNHEVIHLNNSWPTSGVIDYTLLDYNAGQPVWFVNMNTTSTEARTHQMTGQINVGAIPDRIVLATDSSFISGKVTVWYE